jgi:hypothetical protein
MKRLEIKPGTEYGDLKVIREVEASAVGKRQMLCKCSCGRQVTVRLGHLTTGHSTTCGQCGIVLNGKQRTVAGWAREYGIKESTLRARLNLMGLEEALKRG